jgi:hypothetical protein
MRNLRPESSTTLVSIIEAGIIRVAGDGRDGSDFLQVQKCAAADIPGMNNM